MGRRRRGEGDEDGGVQMGSVVAMGERHKYMHKYI